MHNPELTNAPY